MEKDRIGRASARASRAFCDVPANAGAFESHRRAGRRSAFARKTAMARRFSEFAIRRVLGAMAALEGRWRNDTP